MDRRPAGPIPAMIYDVWGDHADFETYGLPYVAFLIEQDVRDMRGADWDESECVEELADVCINAMRMMLERGYNPHDEIVDRLANHDRKGTDDIVERYVQRYKTQAGGDL